MNLLELKGVSQRFGGLQALQDVHLSVREGEIVGIIGPNGAGKSTLFNAIVGLVPPVSGSIIFDGEEMSRLQTHAIASKGVIKTSQTVQVFGEMSVMDNVLVGAILHENQLKKAREIAKEQLNFLDLGKDIKRVANDLTLAGRAKLELARTLAAKPKLLMVDELMAGLNENEVREMLNRLFEINRKMGVTLLVIEHNMKAIMELSDRLIVMDHGKIIAEGDPLMVSNDAKVIEAYLGVG